MRRTKSFLTAEGIESYLLAQSWQIKGIKIAIKKANSKNARFIDNDKVTAWIKSWGSDNVNLTKKLGSRKL
jgi:predicted transcriptional regulator